MPGTAANPQRPVTGYFARWIDRLRTADNLPSSLASRSVRAAIHETPPGCRLSPVEAWLFSAATDHGDGIDLAVTCMADLARNHPFIDGNSARVLWSARCSLNSTSTFHRRRGGSGPSGAGGGCAG